MNDTDGPPTSPGRRPAPRPGPPLQQRLRHRRRYDPAPRTVSEALQRLWVVGLGAVVLVVLFVISTGPGDLSILRRLFIWFSTLAFGVWLLREHRYRLRVEQRRLIFLVCSASLIVLFLVLVISAF